MKQILSIYILALSLSSSHLLFADPAPSRSVLFVGVDISGSFLRSKHFDDSMLFLAHYLHAHLNGYGDLEVPQSLYVGSLGGKRAGEAKTFYPIETFRGESVDGIHRKLKEMFPLKKENPF